MTARNVFKLIGINNCVRLFEGSSFLSWVTIASISAVIAATVVLVAGLIILYSLREIRKDKVVQAFSTVASILYDEKVRMARRTLIGNSEIDFTKWTQKEIDDAEIACFNYDIVGIMVRNKLVNQKMVIKEWRDSIIKSYEHAQPMITTYRKSNGNDFWDDFQWLYGRAKKMKPS